MSKFSASVTVKLHGGPLDGKSAVSYGAVVGSLIDVNHHNYRVTTVDTIPGWTEMIANATFVQKRPLVARSLVVKPKL